MDNLTSKYETIFIADMDLDDEKRIALVEKFKSLIEANGTIEKVEDWGKRRLAYPINDKPDGYYTYVTFTAQHSFPAELERIYKITDGIVRSIVVKLGE